MLTSEQLETKETNQYVEPASIDWNTNTLFIEKNAQDLFEELTWLEALIAYRLENMTADVDIHKPLPPVLNEASSYGKLTTNFQLDTNDRILLALALARSFAPQKLEALLVRHPSTRICSPELGGIVEAYSNHFIPTLQTAIVLACGTSNSDYTKTYHHMTHSILLKEQILQLSSVATGHVFPIRQEIQLVPEFLTHLLDGQPLQPAFSTSFPAKKLRTSYEWDNLILHPKTKSMLQVMIDWLTYGQEVLTRQGKVKKIKEGFPCLFYGPPGTGKTMSAALIGKISGREVYQVDLSMVVSKYIGETEKNLASLFDKAERKNWILFFDEADALFSKRTAVSDAHDKYANQEMSYLLQRMESFPGVTILASNFSESLDPAMTRRFQLKVYFGMPEENERKLLWQHVLPDGFTFDEDIDFDKLAAKYKLTGANMGNIIRHCCVAAVKKGTTKICTKDIQDNIQSEFAKEGKHV